MRIGHFVEAQILQTSTVDESEVLTPADYAPPYRQVWNFTVPFVCGATNLGEALRRASGEGAAMIRSMSCTGRMPNATTHMRAIGGDPPADVDVGGRIVCRGKRICAKRRTKTKLKTSAVPSCHGMATINTQI